MRVFIYLVVALAFSVAQISAQITYVSHATSCAVGTDDKSLCSYDITFNTTAWTAPPNGEDNKFYCTHPEDGQVPLDNPVASQTFAAGQETIEVNAGCDCTSITWSINGSDITISNNNVDAVLNSCDFCGPASGNTACGTGSGDACYEVGVCSAGVCVQSSKCVASNVCFTNECIDRDTGCTGDVAKCQDRLDSCERASCSLPLGICSYQIDTTLTGCDARGLDTTTNPASSPVQISLEESRTIFGVNTEGELTLTKTTSFEVETDGQIDFDTTETFETSDSSYHAGGLSTDAEVFVMLVPIFSFAAAVAILGFLSFSSVTNAAV